MARLDEDQTTTTVSSIAVTIQVLWSLDASVLIVDYANNLN